MYLVENKFGRKLYTYKEIAEIIGVSKAEVKRILRNLPDWEKIKRKK